MSANLKIIVSTSDLSDALSQCIKTVSTSTTMDVLGCYLMVVSDQSLTIKSTNLSEGTEVQVPVEDVEGSGSFIIEAKVITELVKKISSDTIVLSRIDDLLHIDFGTASYKFKLYSEECDYPTVPQSHKHGIKLKSQFFRSLIERAGYAVGDSNKVPNPILGGVNLSFTSTDVQVISLDGYRLAIGKETIEELNSEETLMITIEAKSLMNMVRSLKGNQDIELIVDDHVFYMLCDNTIHHCRLLEGEFMNVTKLIPTEDFKVILKDINREELIKCTERSLLLADGKNSLIRLNIEDGRLCITSNNDLGNTKEEMLATNAVELTDPYLIGLNGKFLLDALKHYPSDVINLKSTNPHAPMLITSDAIKDTALILPIRIAGE